MHVCVLDDAGHVVFDKNLACRPEILQRALEPFRDGLVIGVECMFAWYWVADFCSEHDIAFVLGHALYMKAIHGGKAKNDRIDATKLARLLRGGNFPVAYAYPKGMRETRDLLRRRTYLVRKRAELMTHLQILNAQYNLAPFVKKLGFAANRQEMNIAAQFSDPSVQRSAAADLSVIDRLDEVIGEVELYLTRTAKVDSVQTYHRLQTIPGVGKLLGLILLYEMHEVAELLAEHPVLGPQVLDRFLLLLVDPTRENGQQKLPWLKNEAHIAPMAFATTVAPLAHPSIRPTWDWLGSAQTPFYPATTLG